jgi:hypothetical protein
MHNCKAIRSRLIERALDERLSGQAGLPADLEGCPTCREEFASLRSVLRVADHAMQSTQPEEGFWSDYHTRLSQSLKSGSPAATPVRSGHLQHEFTSWMRKLVTASVPVPVPLAAVLVVLVGGSLLFAMNSRRSSPAESSPGSPSVVTKIVEVPVIQERTVTRVVYRDRNSGTSRGRALSPARSADSAAVARRSSPDSPISLVGFKPANEVKLTIIKGSDRDEK